MRLLLVIMMVLMPCAVMAQTNPTAGNGDAGGSSYAISPLKKELILKFFEASGSRESMTKSLDMMFKNMPQVTPDVAAKMRQEISVDEIVNQLIPVYDRNFTLEDLQGLIDFYESPLGQKLIQTMPGLVRETVGITRKYMSDKLAAGQMPLADQPK